MNGRRAKLIRKIVYQDYSPRIRDDIDRTNPHEPNTEVRHAGVLRANYQHAKKRWVTTREMPEAVSEMQ